MIRNYTVTVETDAPEDLDAAMRRAVGFMAEDIDSTGNFPLTISVVDNATGRYITEHSSDPDMFLEPDQDDTPGRHLRSV